MSSRLRVLVVDDAPDVASLHALFVSSHTGCELVGTAANGPDAFAAMRQLEPDLVLLDVHLPGMSGLDALRRMRSISGASQPEIIAVTAARDVDTVRDARLLGVRHYLVKPFTVIDLHQRIDDVLQERSPGTVTPGRLEQGDVDAVMRPASRSTLPKGLSAETLTLVAGVLAARDEASAADIAEAVGLSRVSCRRYLEHLASTGAAEKSLDYATAGRPSTRYRTRRSP
jgi:response regulator of citrate/malate metabolism